MRTLPQIIKEIAEEVADVGLRPNYCGRSMYRRGCVGVSGSLQACMMVIAETIKQAKIECDEHGFDFDNAVDILLSFSMDDMGMGVILYWPQMLMTTATSKE